METALRARAVGCGCAVLTCISMMGDAGANGLDAGCCADLDSRIAALEATTARKATEKVSIGISGQVNKMLLTWDDGVTGDAYVVGNKNDQSAFSVVGLAKFASGWTTGYDLTVFLLDNLSDSVDQTHDTADDGFFVWQSHWWVANWLGKLSVGLASRASDTAPEVDLSGTGTVAYSGVQDVGGGFSLRLSDGSLAPLTWGGLYNHFNGDTANLVRYDTPVLNGFVASATLGEDDVWDAALRYARDGGGFQFESAIAYTELSDGADPVIGNPLSLDHSTVVGSFSLLHEATGLSITYAAGSRAWGGAVTDIDGVDRRPDDTTFHYAKLGWVAALHPIGETAFYGEYGRFRDAVTVTDEHSLLHAIDPTGDATHIHGSEAEVWGLGLVQNIEAAEMQVFIGYRCHSASFALADDHGHHIHALGVNDFETFVAGSKVTF